MQKCATAIGLAAAIATLSFTAVRADDVTIIERDTDTTGSIIVRKPAPRVVVREREPTVVIREQRQEPRVIIREDEPDRVIVKKRKRVIYD